MAKLPVIMAAEERGEPSPYDEGDQLGAGPDEDGVSIEETEDGDIVVNYGTGKGIPNKYRMDRAGMDEGGQGPFMRNLALEMEDSDLLNLANDLVTAIQEDDDSRNPWQKRLARGIRMMGVTDDNTPGPFVGASRVVHPLVAEAGVQFQARAIAEAWPAEGPAKARPLGDPSEEILKRVDRVQQHLNYQYTVEMREAFEEHDQMLNRLPLDGSAFKKVHFDPNLDRLTSEFVVAEDLIIPYSATSMATAPRITHVLRKYKNDILKDMASGFYRTLDLQDPTDDQPSLVDEEIDKAEGREPNCQRP